MSGGDDDVSKQRISHLEVIRDLGRELPLQLNVTHKQCAKKSNKYIWMEIFREVRRRGAYCHEDFNMHKDKRCTPKNLKAFKRMHWYQWKKELARKYKGITLDPKSGFELNDADRFIITEIWGKPIPEQQEGGKRRKSAPVPTRSDPAHDGADEIGWSDEEEEAAAGGGNDDEREDAAEQDIDILGFSDIEGESSVAPLNADAPSTSAMPRSPSVTKKRKPAEPAAPKKSKKSKVRELRKPNSGNEEALGTDEHESDKDKLIKKQAEQLKNQGEEIKRMKEMMELMSQKINLLAQTDA